MSGVFAQNSSRYVIAHEATSAKRLLDENEHIIELVADLARKGRFRESVQLQTVLQRNLVYLVSLVDQNNLDSNHPVDTDTVDK
ncbi:SS18-like protein [Schistosoma japonicum]|uniref:SJCHGC03056 protein n=1 Tax=Schistosoma japonicum TaxID=6182 RepID=Q5BSY5_SCHJA|nr:SJCHGC03056 protein [Schistosoma japonicum]KAH8849021.1 hypothetical protein KSF78_0000016 [Schistosoma japonicum]KAH8849022.1 hypothetical protein KSF78_0000016 [Schistosoma japonicum]TNN11281.1 SS18-like protein [Schistosoma japonicum]TNN11282.1 SS18-like protein [Schistosoma japonicum]